MLSSVVLSKGRSNQLGVEIFRLSDIAPHVNNALYIFEEFAFLTLDICVAKSQGDAIGISIILHSFRKVI